MSELTTIDPLLTAEDRFKTSRQLAFEHIANTARAGIALGTLLCELRTETGSEKKFGEHLAKLGASLPIEETHRLMKVAARYANEGDRLFLNKTSAVWAQSEMGLLPPPTREPKSKQDPSLPVPDDALTALGQALRKVHEVIAAMPVSSWEAIEQREAQRMATELLRAVTP